ncbi:COG1355, Predicted dioxygenase / COG2078: Uncharacterized ACR [hydrothermal vent metagenome]|uniref:COG1355, Predicted dioxygenase / COG2078: Uncharacterized ACR n=1 Tax=hydrothermal vent metagenome TaxID=652676 RepID=A0A3B0XUQ3_9ZZZZ
MITQAPFVAGRFYASNADCLKNDIKSLLQQVIVEPASDNIKALIVPHAAYIYSGSVAASAYAYLQNFSHKIRRVIILGPSHRHPKSPLSSHSADFFRTPLGAVPIDQSLREQLQQKFGLQIVDHVFTDEHCIEVQLPFLQTVLQNFRLLPILIGSAGNDSQHNRSDLLSNIIQALWDEDDILFIISTDLSHFHQYHSAKDIDANTIDMTLQMRHESLGFEHACGLIPLTAIIKASKKQQAKIKLLAAANSGDTAGDHHRVVGYASFKIESRENSDTCDS